MILAILALVPGAFALLSLGQTIVDLPRRLFDWLDDRAAERPEWISVFLEMKTVWHPIGV